MKIAVIVVGSHHTGKSTTINEHLKPKLGIGKKKHRFTLDKDKGLVLSQSFEEADSCPEEKLNSRRLHYNLLVLAARPEKEEPSSLLKVEDILKKAGFTCHRVEMDERPAKEKEDNYFESKANEILALLTNS